LYSGCIDNLCLDLLPSQTIMVLLGLNFLIKPLMIEGNPNTIETWFLPCLNPLYLWNALQALLLPSTKSIFFINKNSLFSVFLYTLLNFYWKKVLRLSFYPFSGLAY